MSIITIQCRLIAEDNTLRQLWELMADKYTPFINELLVQIGQHSEFEEWLKKGEVPKETIESIRKSLSTQEPFVDQPARFYTSAVILVKEIYKSWFALQQKRLRRIAGKERWLKIFKSDVELQQESQCDLDIIRNKAKKILNSFDHKTDQAIKPTSEVKQSKKKGSFEDSKLFTSLFDLYDETEDCLSKCAIAYLLKNDCQVSEIDEEEVQYTKRRRQKEIQIERLREQLNSQKPQGRDLTGEKWLSTLKDATNQVPLDEFEAKSWQDSLLRQSSDIPYPVDYETNTDLDWMIHSADDEIKRKIILVWQVYFLSHLIKSGSYGLIKYLYFKFGCLHQKDMNWLNLHNKLGRIFVKFNGLKKNISNPEFYICCDSRQLHYFQRFCQDWQVWHDNETTYSSALFVLRSARLLWQEREGTGVPWKVHRLMLQCSIETGLWTEEETELVRTEKIFQSEKIIRNMEQKGDLNQKQLSRLQGERTHRQALNQYFPHCPSKSLYQGKSNIIVGVSFGLDKPVTLAVVDVVKNEVLAYRNVKQLLGKNYNLFNRQRQQQQRLSHERHKAQKRNAPNSFGESELGKYVDRLLADAIIAIAKTYQASSIVLPKLCDMREQISSEIQSRAEKKCPGYKEAQKKYAKAYQISIHRWSYRRLIESIKSQAAQVGICIEIGTQPIRGSPQEKARDLAIFAYQERHASLV